MKTQQSYKFSNNSYYNVCNHVLPSQSLSNELIISNKLMNDTHFDAWLAKLGRRVFSVILYAVTIYFQRPFQK